LLLLEASMKQAGFDHAIKRWPDGVKALKYAVICLYKGQLNLFNRAIKDQAMQEFVTISTVDQMQGSEVDVAIVSAVRASDCKDSSGFADDIRRLTVSLSRSAVVYVLAKYTSFKSEKGWSTLYRFASNHHRA